MENLSSVLGVLFKKDFAGIELYQDGDRLIMAYMSIGQAEDYRSYWQRDWPANAPESLDEGDEVWAGDFWVRYWDPGRQDIIYGYLRDHEPSPPEWTAEHERILDKWVDAGKSVLTVDYTSRADPIADAYERARARGYVPYVADPSLGRLRTDPGF